MAMKTGSLTASYGEFGAGDDGRFERQRYLDALANLVAEAIEERHGNLDIKLLTVIAGYQRDLGIPLLEGFDEDTIVEAGRSHRIAMMRDLLQRWPKPEVAATSGLQVRVNFLARIFGLTSDEAAIFGLMARRNIYRRWNNLLSAMVRRDEIDNAFAFSIVLGFPRDVLDAAFDDRGRFSRCGLAECKWITGGNYAEPHGFVLKFLEGSAVTDAEMISALMPVLSPSTLGAESFAHMQDDLDRATRLVADALSTGARANILLYGVPGAGKTEFARLIAGSNGALAVSIGEADDDGGEPARHERLAHLRLCRRLMPSTGKTVLIIDEAEDLFISGIEHRGSKLWLNRLVEDGGGTHIWIVNQPATLGEPILRRMDLAIRFDVPAAPLRRALAEHMIASHGACEMQTADEVSKFADSLAEICVAPAIIASALRTGARLGAKPAEITSIARDLAEATGRIGLSPSLAGQSRFDPACSRATYDLCTLATKLSGTSAHWSLLLSGLPGTGKTAYAHHLAEQIGCYIIVKSGADMLGAFVGQTEQAIASAFVEAERRRAILLIDEADTFLASRNLAQRNWEVSMTNEMLRQIERSRVRFIATTNRAITLDPASARRFSLHVNFLSLDAQRARQMFTDYFGVPPPHDLDRIADLTPGDFAQAAKRADLLNATDPALLVRWLQEAVEVRDGTKGRIGF